MKRLIALFLLTATQVFGVETLTIDSVSRNVINVGAVNFATGQLKVNNIAVTGGGTTSGPGGGTIDNVRLNLPTDLFNSPVDYVVSGGLAEGTATFAAQPAGTVFANVTGGSATPTFVLLATLKSAMGLNNVDNTSDLNKPISIATQAALDVLTTGVSTNTTNIASLTTTVAGKADSSAMTSALALKADITYVNSSIAAFTGTTNIATVGTITTGTWQGTAIGNTYLPDLDSLAAPNSDLSLNSHKIISLADPTNATDATNKQYVDSVATTGPPHSAVRVATTANGTLATAYENGDTVDGITLATGNRILLKDQTTGTENGIYTVNGSGAPTRATDADAGAEVSGSVFVSGGTVNGGSTWGVTTPQPITLGSTSVAYTQTAATTIYSAGPGLTLTGSQFSLANLSGAGKLLGRYSSGAGVPQEVTVGSGLALDGSGNLTSTGQITGFSSGNLSPLFTTAVSTANPAIPALSFTLSSAAANTFFGNGTGTSASPTFMDAATARTALGGSTIGQSMFTLTNPSNIRFPRFNADNSVSALDATTFRNAIGAGTVTNLTTSGNTGFLFSVLPTLTTTTPDIAFSLPSVSANTFYGNGTASQAVPTFMTAGTARTALGGTTVGQNMFTLTPISAISYVRMSATNTVSAAVPATVLSDIGAASTSDPRFPASVTGIRKSAGAGSTDSAAMVNVDYAKDSEAVATNAAQVWPAGTITLRQNPVAPLSGNQIKTLPAANIFAAGTVISYIDAVTTGNFGPILTPAGGNTLNGGSVGIIPFIAGSTGANGNKTVQLETDGLSAWTILGIGSISEVQDSADAKKRFTFDASKQSGVTPGVVTAAPGQTYTFQSTLSDTPGVLVNANGNDTGSPGTFTKQQLTKTDVIPAEDPIGTATLGVPDPISGSSHDVPTDGTIDTVRIVGAITGAYQIAWPPANNYKSGETVALIDSSNSVLPSRPVTVVPAATTTDTFNGAPTAVFNESRGRKLFTSNGSNAWDVTITKTVVQPFTTISCSGGTCNIPVDSNAGKQNVHLLLASGPNRLVIPGAFDGMPIELVLVQPSSGTATLILPQGSRTVGGTGISLTGTINAIDRLRGSYDGIISAFLWDAPISDQKTAAPPSPAPSGLSAGSPTSTAITLSWTDNSSNEDGFEVYRSTTSGSGFNLIATTGPGIQSYPDSGLLSSTAYYYKVRATNTGGFSAYTSEATSTTLSGAPTGNLLDWHFNDNGGSGFGVAATTGSGPPGTMGGGLITSWTTATENSTGAAALMAVGVGQAVISSVTTSGTTGATTYNYKVAGWMNGPTGSSPTHGTLSGQVGVTNGNAVLNNTNKNVITWNALTNPTPDYYEVYRTSATGGTPSSIGRIATLGSGTLTLDDTGLPATPGTIPPISTSNNIYQVSAATVAGGLTAATVDYTTALTYSQTSVSFWVKSAFTPTAATDIINNGTGAFRIQATTGNKLLLVMNGNTGQLTATVPTNTTSLNNGSWHHVVVLMDASTATESPTGTVTTTPSSTDTLRVYIDNVATSVTYTLASWTGPYIFPTGTPKVGSSGFAGSIDDVRIYNRLLNTTEIAALKNGHAQ